MVYENDKLSMSFTKFVNYYACIICVFLFYIDRKMIYRIEIGAIALAFLEANQTF